MFAEISFITTISIVVIIIGIGIIYTIVKKCKKPNYNFP